MQRLLAMGIGEQLSTWEATVYLGPKLGELKALSRSFDLLAAVRASTLTIFVMLRLNITKILLELDDNVIAYTQRNDHK